jgi:hypothetical protein
LKNAATLLQYTINIRREAINIRQTPICTVSKFIESRAINQLVIPSDKANNGVISQVAIGRLLRDFGKPTSSEGYRIDVDQLAAGGLCIDSLG